MRCFTLLTRGAQSVALLMRPRLLLPYGNLQLCEQSLHKYFGTPVGLGSAAHCASLAGVHLLRGFLEGGACATR